MALGLAAGLAGCTQPIGPVFGEWRGEPPGRNTNYPKSVDLVLGGGPGARSGQYHITSTELNANSFSNHGERQWGGAWTSAQRVVNGQAMQFITLQDHLPDDIGGYALEADGRLHALDPDGSLDMTAVGALYTLSPIPPRGVD